MADAIRRLCWSPDADPRVKLRAAWYRQTDRRFAQVHCHTFYEFFFIEQGTGRQPINGRVWELTEGDLVFIRPDDVHGFATIGGEPWSWTNVALHRSAEAQLRRRFAGDVAVWPWREGPMPMRVRLSAGQLQTLRQAMLALPPDVHRRLDLDWLMAGVLRLLQTRPAATGETPPPPWLDKALRRLREGGPLEPRRLVQLSQRSREHVNRTVRRHFGMTSNQLVHRLRLDRAARELRQSDRPVIAIAQDAGYDNLSYFYRRFRQHFGVTPRQFRLHEFRPGG